MPGRNHICFTPTPFSCPPLLLLQTTANKTLEEAFWKEKTKVLLVHDIKIIMSFSVISRFFFHWSEWRYLLQDLDESRDPSTARLNSCNTRHGRWEHWWIAEKCSGQLTHGRDSFCSWFWFWSWITWLGRVLILVDFGFSRTSWEISHLKLFGAKWSPMLGNVIYPKWEDIFVQSEWIF